MPKGKKDKGGRGKAKPMRKVTRKGAYKPSVKNQMMLRRAPVVELKNRTHSDVALANGHDIVEKNDDEKENYDFLTQGDTQQPLNWRIVPNDNAFTLIPLTPFYRNQRGLEPYQILGDSLTSKWLNTKIEVRFPQGEIFPKIKGNTTTLYRNMMIQENVKVYAIWGYVTHSINAPLTNVGGTRKALDEWTQADILSFLQSEIEPYFDQSIDKLSFRPKETMNLRIEKYVRLKPNLSSTISTQATASHGSGNSSTTIAQATGSVPNIMKTHNFTINRKVLYSEGYPAEQQSGETDYQNLLPNNSFLPWCILYSPDFASMDAVQHQTDGTTNPTSRLVFAPDTERRTQNMFVRYNSQHLYTDS